MPRQGDEIEVKVHSFGSERNLSLVWYDPLTGKKCAKSAGTKDPGKAERKAAEHEKALNDGTYARPSRITWQEFRERWVAEKGPEVADKTVEAATTAFNWVERTIGKPDLLRKMTTATIVRLKAKAREGGMKDTTLGAHLGHLKAALSWANKHGLLAVMPRIEKPTRAKGVRFMRGRPCTEEEFDRIVLAVPKVRPHDAAVWTRYLRGLWLSGLRSEESVVLSWDQDAPFCVDLSGRRPVFRIRAEAQKAGRDEILPMTPDFAEFLLETPEADRHGRVFPLNRMDNGQPFADGKVGGIVGQFGKRAGVVVNRTRKPVWVDLPDGTRKKVVKDNVPEFATSHTFRRAFGSRWARRVPTITLQKLMRHASIETTVRFYVDIDADELADELWAKWAAPQGGAEKPVGNKLGNIGPKSGGNGRRATVAKSDASHHE